MRRYRAKEKAAVVRMVRTLCTELGTEHGKIQRVAGEVRYGVESVRSWGASIASWVRWNMGGAARSVLDMRNDFSTCQRSWYFAITSAAGMTAAGRLVT